MKVFIFFILILFSLNPLLSQDSSGNSEHAFGGGYTTFNKKNNSFLGPKDGFNVRIQSGNGRATYFSPTSNLEFIMSGKKDDDFIDKNGNKIEDVRYDLYIINYSLGLRFSMTPHSPLAPYLGVAVVGSITTLQIKNKTSAEFSEQHRAFMYGYDFIAGIDFFISGNKEKGWGFRLEGNTQTLFPINKFDFGRKQIQPLSATLMFVTTI